MLMGGTRELRKDTVRSGYAYAFESIMSAYIPASLSNGRPNVTEDDLERKDYLKAVIKETLRLYPPSPLLSPRESTQDVKIKGYIAAARMVFTNAWAIGRDPASWEEADKFCPERFLENNAYGSIDFKGHDFQLIPFGAGRRGCPGISFAIAANELVLATVLKRFDWALPNTGENLDMSECVGLAIHRKVPLVATATPHNSR
ncbi:hypothetical protein HS088_TW13G01624 [Tripterygium wilfordii]|uniref:Uncharacterized protein n=1 Tax=Tripterygium wilfordii TaxID=458696 RepID=A0A7J7CXB1_TRIWF|nr:hypothetical protein HS088_TW13G01624 [Tripterygium wilfordii]